MRIGLTARIYFYFIAGVIIASLFSILIMYFDYNNYIITGIERNLIRGAIDTENIIDPAKHNSLINTSDGRNTEYYIETLEKLNNLRETGSFSYIYTLVKLPDNKFYFIFDTEDYQVSPGDKLSFMREYENMPHEVLKAYNSKMLAVTENYYTDEWGTFKSAFLPVMNSAKNVEYIIGVDFDATYIASLNKKILLISLIALGAILPFVIILIILLKRDVVKHVNLLTEEIKTSEQINISLKNYLSNIIESMPSMLITIDENNIVTQWNQAAVIATGIPSSEIMGKQITDATQLFNTYLTSSNEIMNNGKPVEFYRKRLTDDDTHLRNITLFPLVANCAKGLVIRIDDITELEQKDQQLRQMQKMEIVGNLAGGLAHDFNNMLGGIMGALSVIKLKRKNGTLSEAMLNDYLTMMEEAGVRATDMAKQLLFLSHNNETSLIPIDLISIINHTEKICRNTFDKSIIIEMEMPEEPVIISADATQIEQVLLNLFVNASHAMTIMRKANEKHGGKLSIVIEKINADQNFILNHPEAETADYWQISIRDTGVGMDTKTAAKIFEPFFTTKAREKGTGLGLSVAYNIIKTHKGFIDVYSEPGWGTEFTLYIPALETNSSVININCQKKYIEGEGLILVIDDEDVIRKITSEILKECGYDVITATDGFEGIEILKREIDNIRLTIIDMVMPGKNGLETCKEIRQIKPDAKIIITSGFKKDERIDQLTEYRTDGFIQKPYTIERLSRLVHEILSD